VATAAAAVDVDRLNYINIGLMLLAAAVAWLVPFELFLLSYAVLGPLHYLTQISWLHDRGYFTTGRLDWIPLALLALVAFLYSYEWLPWDGAYFVALGAGAVAAFVPNHLVKLASLGVLVVSWMAVEHWVAAWLFFVLLLGTIIHVYVFTGVFILAGSLKSRSTSGYVSFAVFLACGLGLLAIQPAAQAYAISPGLRENLVDFEAVITTTAGLMPGDGGWDAIVATGRFLGFAYTYHYLNWFSKTGIIRWHEMSRGRLGVIGVVYAASLALYAYDYRTGIMALYFLSIVHVFLEFPLDARTIREVSSRLRGGGAAVGVPASGSGTTVGMHRVVRSG
jgi:hypothetical protein